MILKSYDLYAIKRGLNWVLTRSGRQFFSSRLEKRRDLLLATLRNAVEAMGGNLSLVAEFRDRAPVVSGIAEDDQKPEAEDKHSPETQTSGD